MPNEKDDVQYLTIRVNQEKFLRWFLDIQQKQKDQVNV